MAPRSLSLLILKATYGSRRSVILPATSLASGSKGRAKHPARAMYLQRNPTKLWTRAARALEWYCREEGGEVGREVVTVTRLVLLEEFELGGLVSRKEPLRCSLPPIESP